jgi:ribosome maturation factor RimP
MITEKQLSGIIAEYLENKSIFPVEISIRSDNRIFVYVDGDQGVTIDDCKALSRFIESKLNRDQEDYDLTVSTAGADSPLKLQRQYPRHIGRTFEITLNDETQISGKLVSADEEAIVIESTGGKKNIQKENKTISFNQIKEAKIVLSFK